MVVDYLKGMKAWKFVAILLILDFSLGFVIYNNQNTVSTEEYDICEEGSGYELIDATWSSFPVRYYIDDNIKHFEDIILQSIEVWNMVVNTELFTEASSETDVDLIIYLGETSSEFALGETGLYFESPFSKEIQFSEIIISNDYQFADLEFSCEIQALEHTQVFDLQSILVHELGHVLSLDHSNNYYNTMYFSYSGTFQKTLTAGDIEGFHQRYPNVS